MSANQSSLHGTWKLLSFELESQGSSERERPLGANPTGYLMLTPAGRMMAVVTGGGRKPGSIDAEQLALFRSMLAYTGTYESDGERFNTQVDCSWNEAWTGTNQERFYTLMNDRLDILTAWAPHPIDAAAPRMRGILSWERER